MSGTLSNQQLLLSYPQLAGAQDRMALAQQLMGTAAAGPQGTAAASAFSPVASALQGIVGGIMGSQAQGQFAQVGAQQQAQRNQLIARLLGQPGGLAAGGAGLPTIASGTPLPGNVY